MLIDVLYIAGSEAICGWLCRGMQTNLNYQKLYSVQGCKTNFFAGQFAPLTGPNAPKVLPVIAENLRIPCPISLYEV